MINAARAMVFEGAGRPLASRSFTTGRPASGEVLVRVTFTTLCGSDLHTYQGRRTTPCPTILGHEILGRVAGLPDEPVIDLAGRPLEVGDRVTWSIAASCGVCHFCRRELPQKCERLFKYGHEKIEPAHPLSGGLAEYCHLARGTALLRVPDELPDEVACPANCATATVAAALRVAGDCRDAVVLIQGAGMLGLTASAMANSQGARAIVVSDPDANRLPWALRFGATHAIHVKPGSDELAQAVQATTDGRGVDVALELSGSPEAIETGLQLLRIGGRYLWVGAVFPAREVAISAEHVVRRLVRIEGVHNYTPVDLKTAVEFLAANHTRYPFAELVSGRFELADAEAAFQFALATKAPRVAIVPTS
jgi:putative phosphonate catabolism associated alcohol dehydrogenase